MLGWQRLCWVGMVNVVKRHKTIEYHLKALVKKWFFSCQSPKEQKNLTKVIHTLKLIIMYYVGPNN